MSATQPKTTAGRALLRAAILEYLQAHIPAATARGLLDDLEAEAAAAERERIRAALEKHRAIRLGSDEPPVIYLLDAYAILDEVEPDDAVDDE